MKLNCMCYVKRFILSLQSACVAACGKNQISFSLINCCYGLCPVGTCTRTKDMGSDYFKICIHM